MTDRLRWLIVAGARPNFIKIAPLIWEIKRYNTTRRIEKKIIPLIVHTGQHYDKSMSELFFYDLNIPYPDINLSVGSGRHGEQTGKIMIAFEEVLLEIKPGLVIVVGDVNSTLACALVAAKLCIPVAHVESGLRSFDRTMPEEINRILTDQISDFLFTHSRDADENLLKEGIPKEKIFFVGNIIIDSLNVILRNISDSAILSKLHGILSHQNILNGYAILTLHRPSNVDYENTLKNMLDCFNEISEKLPILFPIHPRTKKQIISFGLENRLNWLNDDFHPVNGPIRNYIYCLPPLGYHDFIALMRKSKMVFTDSGGSQEESTIMGIPCITLRENTERPVTVTEGTNTVVGNDPSRIKKAFEEASSKQHAGGRIPELWDGRTAERIINILTCKKT